jgi:hypothetical protein
MSLRTGRIHEELKALERTNHLIARIDLQVRRCSAVRSMDFRACAMPASARSWKRWSIPLSSAVKNADAFVAFTGLDPRPDDSGAASRQTAPLKRGPAELPAALSSGASAKDEAWRPLYEHYRAKGLPSTAALVISLGASLAAWSIYTYKTEFDPRLTKPLT